MKQKSTNLSLILAILTFTWVAHADPIQVTATSEQTVLVSDCGPRLELSRIDFEKNFTDCDAQAEQKCQGKAKRVSAYAINPGCVSSPVWNAKFLSVSFQARYECL